MCGRYLVSMEDEIVEIREIINEVNEKYKDAPQLSVMKTGEIFPTEVAPVLISENKAVSPALLKWGFPRPGGKGVIINARAETAAQSRMFSSAFERRRCVIPASGFFEWRSEGEVKKKVKYLFRSTVPEPLYFAGIYATFPFVKEISRAYVIITTSANPFISQYHDRMPLIIPQNGVGRWLTDRSFAIEALNAPCNAHLNAIVA